MDIKLNNLQKSSLPQNSGPSHIRKASPYVGSLAPERRSDSITKENYLQKSDNGDQTQDGTLVDNKELVETDPKLTNLTKLLLDDNEISEIAPEVTTPLTNLKDLYLGHNQLSEIAPKSSKD